MRSQATESDTASVTPRAIAGKAARGSVALGARQIAVQGMNLVGGVMLARMLTPAEFGIFAIVMILLAFLLSLSDVGLGASLIRQPEQPTTEDYRSVFSVQQLLVLILLLICWPLAEHIALAYGRPAGDGWVFRLAALAVFVTSLQTIPAIRLERHLEFGRLAVVEVAQALVFNGVAVGLAWSGAGAISIAWALLARSITGAVLANLVSPWPIGWAWNPQRLRVHLRFGLPYQGISFVSLLKDSISPVLIGLLVGATAVGYVNWGLMVAAYPVLALMALQRVYLPAFSRMSATPAELARFVEMVIRATNFVVAPLALLTLVLARDAIPIVFGEKWLPGLPFFYLFWAANLFVPTATPLLGLLNALGLSGLAFRFALLWMVGTWLIGAPLILAFGPIGFAVANLLVQFTNLMLYRSARARVPFRILRPILPFWILASIAGASTFGIIRLYPPGGIWGLLMAAAAGGTIYLLSVVALYPAALSRVRGLLLEGARWSHGFR